MRSPGRILTYSWFGRANIPAISAIILLSTYNKTMPYDNAYNRGVAKVYDRWNDRFSTLFAYSPVDGMGGYSGGGSSAGVLFQMGNASKRDAEDNVINDDLSLPPVYYLGNSAEMSGGNGFAEGSFRDTGYGHSEGVTGVYKKGSGMSGGGVSGGGVSGGNLFGDIFHGFEDLGSDIGKAVEYVNPFGSGHPAHHKEMKARLLGRMLGKLAKKHQMEGKGASGGGMSGGSWWDALKEGISDVVGVVPHLLLHGLGQEVPQVVVGGAILGNPDPYPVQGNSQRIAGRGKITKAEKKALQSVLEKHTEKRGRGRPRGSGKKQLLGKDGDLLAMPAPVALANGVPPEAQLQGSYGGGKPHHTKAEMRVMKAVEKKLKGKGVSGGMKNLSGMTDRTIGGGASGGKNLSGMTDHSMSGDGRKARAEIVKRIMKERGVKMIEASRIVKSENLYKKT